MMSDVQIESGTTFLLRVQKKTDLSNLTNYLFPRSIKEADIIEITGDSGSGKSFLCLHIMVSCLMPKTWCGININGHSGNVVFIDCERHFNILHFGNMIERRIKKEFYHMKDNKASSDQQSLLKLSKKELQANIDSLVIECLKRFMYVNCSNSQQFAIALMSMDQVILKNPNTSLVVVDAISSFYWYDREYRTNSWQKTENYYSTIFHKLFEIIRLYRLIAICIKQDFFMNTKYQDGENSKSDHYCFGKEWNKMVTISVTITKTKHSEKNIYSIESCCDNSTKSCFCTFHEDGIKLLD